MIELRIPTDDVRVRRIWNSEPGLYCQATHPALVGPRHPHAPPCPSPKNADHNHPRSPPLVARAQNTSQVDVGYTRNSSKPKGLKNMLMKKSEKK
ncbi:hypothetical protein PGTUg99_000795 [Puccinia graminis f. sp. tritici]|uniref:Uncharacterized protein n=1 Tax=Puccinia graminis f. sp. tritici TaxID=56615 RepID=A0A5B0PA99_PUCGR|nr:hypothetical protein PGTUg99_000795 [Puccinia graminis f. sp. tritici]